MKKKIVIALGGNALGKNLKEQMLAVKQTSKAIADLIEAGHEVVVTHGNGPQVGLINEAMDALYKTDTKKYEKVSLSMCVAMSQAYIGYDLQNALKEELLKRNISKPVTTIVTQVAVDPNDPGFKNPTKPIGAYLTPEEIEQAKANNRPIVEDSGRGYRYVVASPKPKEIIEIDAVKALLNENAVVITCGGGGIPVVKEADGSVKGIPAVIDKDFASSLLARELNADVLIILTAVEKAAINFNTPNQKNLDVLTVSEALKYISEGQFGKGSMQPKIQAAADFVKANENGTAIITLLEKAKDGIEGKTGTRIVP